MGYMGVQAMMSQVGVFCNSGFAFFGTLFVVIVCNYSILVKLVAQDFSDLDEMWKDPTTTTELQRYLYLLNMCKKLHDMNKYDVYLFLILMAVVDFF